MTQQVQELLRAAKKYAMGYVQDEAHDLECCVSEEQHKDAKALFTAIKDAELAEHSPVEVTPAPNALEWKMENIDSFRDWWIRPEVDAALRAEFEPWATVSIGQSLAREPKAPNIYVNAFTQTAWEGFVWAKFQAIPAEPKLSVPIQPGEPTYEGLQRLLNHLADRIEVVCYTDGSEHWKLACSGIAKLLRTGWPFPGLGLLTEAAAPTPTPEIDILAALNRCARTIRRSLNDRSVAALCDLTDAGVDAEAVIRRAEAAALTPTPQENK